MKKSAALDTALNLLFPPQCLCCDEPVRTHGTLCQACWNAIGFITDPLCARCGTPFDFSAEAAMECGACLASTPPFSRARAALCYDDASRPLITRYKYQDQQSFAATFGPWLARAGAEVLEGADALVPVPLHWRKLLMRRFNQAALLAQHTGRHCGVPVWADTLIRTRYTAPQAGLEHAARQKNVRGAFAVKQGAEARIAGKTLVLMDDVYTTGATLSACAHALLKAGAGEVRVLTLARRI